MKSFDNALKPSQKPVCYSVQELLQKYKSTSKDSTSGSECQELFQTIQTDTNRSLEAPESTIIQQHFISNDTKIAIQQQDVEELPIIQENDVIMQINHMHSIFKYLQKEEQSQKLSTNVNSQHQEQQSKIEQHQNQAQKISKQPSFHVTNTNATNQKKALPEKSPIRNSSPFQANKLKEFKKLSPYNRNKSPINYQRNNQIPQTQRSIPSVSPMKKAKENNISQINQKQRNEKSQPKINTQRQKVQQNDQSYVVVDFTKCPTQRVLLKQDTNRPKMKVDISLRNLILKGI